ncbi:MAG TPA: hypothetical protein VG269_09235 [Tepidisphaeraceae bacterium]|jgi:hypothetical protein|nr:hypothetical protein [Tepidisphaeraceae bacterium]
MAVAREDLGNIDFTKSVMKSAFKSVKIGFAQRDDFAQKSGGLKQFPDANNPVQSAAI